MQKTGVEKVLIVTNRPAIANSWFSDYTKFLGSESGYLFVSEVDTLKGKRGVLTREEYTHLLLGKDSENVKCIEFVSLQDMKGSIYFGGQYAKLGEVANMGWDILVIDEAHEGVDTYKTDVAFDRIKRKFTLHLSGTPFKALANNKFADDAIYNWTYADEQKKKRDWDVSAEEENPYATLPQLNLYTYQMSEIIKDELQRGIEIDGETEEYAFDLNEFFAVTNGKFNHEASVDKFLDAMTRQTKFPFSTEELRDELKHTFWLLDRVDSVKALAKKLKEHPVFKEYEIVLAAGDGKLDNDDENMKSYDKVVAAIAQHIPPQKTNQIFTPKTMVKKMVDMLEQENPGCFDMPDKTFIDLYMKSGLYITEIVKRLYQSDEMKKQFPDNRERLKHIFEKQVYGLAPTEIIYKIATSYILGFDEDTKDIKHNFRQLDALPYAKEGMLEQVLDELYFKEK